MKNKYLSARVSRVSRLCPIFRAQPGACPPETQNQTLRRRAGARKIRPKPSAAGSVERGDTAIWTRPAAWGVARDMERVATKQEKAKVSCAHLGKHNCPQCGQFGALAQGLLRGQK